MQVNRQVTGKQLVIISSTSNSNSVGVKFRDVNVPVLTWEVALYDDMEMTGNGNNDSGTGGDNAVNIRRGTPGSQQNPTHPLAGGFSNGSLQISGGNQSLTWGNPNNNADVIAIFSNNQNRATIFSFETGRAMDGGFVAPARRVGFFFTNGTAANINGNGWTLFDAAINWALGKT